MPLPSLLSSIRTTAGLALVLATLPVLTQTPGFTASMVHGDRAAPVGEGPRLNPSPGVVPKGDPAAPRQFADRMADLFSHACVQNEGRPDAVEAWAAERGFHISRQPAKAKVPAATVFTSKTHAPALSLRTTRAPQRCEVWVVGGGTLDGQRVRRRLQEIAVTAGGARAAVAPAHNQGWAGGTLRQLRYPVGNGYVEAVVPEGVAAASGALVMASASN